MALGDVLSSIQRLEDVPRLAGALGYTAAWRELPPNSLGAPGMVGSVGRNGDFEWFAALGGGRDIAITGTRALLSAGIAGGFLLVDEACRRLTVAVGDGPPLELSLDRPDPLDLARLERCAARRGERGFEAAFRIAEALGVRRVDHAFFAAFRRILDQVIASLPPRMPPADRHAVALLQLTRILFLYFVEAKGWLAGRPRFLREEVDRCLAARRSLHRDLLQPLFFGTLNRPFPVRSTLARKFGPIPFLNGGLFEPHALERRWRATVPTPVLRDAFDDLFDRFHFTLENRDADAVAPDMLGRVFEGVMEPAERHSSGSYYTPARLVDSVLRDGLATWLSIRRRIAWNAARRSVDDPDPGTRLALRDIRLLDPAVGSGAFLLGALRVLAGPGASAERRISGLRRILTRNLFGVDRNAAAVRLAELRLWLEVVAADPAERPADIRPLPNLDALIRQGDSLVDPAAGLPMRVPSRARTMGLARLRAQVVGACGAAKPTAIAALRRAELLIAADGLRGAVLGLDVQIADLVNAARSPTLFGELRGLAGPERARLAELRRARQGARERLRALERAGEVPWFQYSTHFADVVANGGFDLVAGNPPWVRAEALDPAFRRYLAERFRWFRPGRRGSRGYIHQPDLSIAFVERALELLAPGGVVAFLLPAKLATTGYATVARDELARRTTIAVAADLRQDPRAAFDATVYPMALVAAREAPARNHRIRLGLGVLEGSVPQLSLGAAPWALQSGPVREVIARLHQTFPALDERVTCHLGVKTGLNRVFLDPPRDIEPALIRWAVRGRDVRAFKVRPVRRLFWPCDPSGRALSALPPAAARHVAAHAGDLRRRTDHVRGHPWSLFRTRPASATHRVVWADLSRRLEAAPLTGPRGPELIPLNTCYVVPVRGEAEAVRLAGWLNSTWCRALAAATADPASGGFARFNARVVGSLPCPASVMEDDALLELAREGLRGRLAQESLDDRCGVLLGLADAERAALAGLAASRAEPGG